jgi:hypothetical protein
LLGGKLEFEQVVLHFFIIFIDGLSIIRVEKVDIFGYDPVG